MVKGIRVQIKRKRIEKIKSCLDNFKWTSFGEIQQKTGIPKQTLIRYLNKERTSALFEKNVEAPNKTYYRLISGIMREKSIAFPITQIEEAKNKEIFPFNRTWITIYNCPQLEDMPLSDFVNIQDGLRIISDQMYAIKYIIRKFKMKEYSDYIGVEFGNNLPNKKARHKYGEEVLSPINFVCTHISGHSLHMFIERRFKNYKRVYEGFFEKKGLSPQEINEKLKELDLLDISATTEKHFIRIYISIFKKLKEEALSLSTQKEKLKKLSSYANHPCLKKASEKCPLVDSELVKDKFICLLHEYCEIYYNSVIERLEYLERMYCETKDKNKRERFYVEFERFAFESLPSFFDDVYEVWESDSNEYKKYKSYEITLWEKLIELERSLSQT